MMQVAGLGLFAGALVAVPLLITVDCSRLLARWWRAQPDDRAIAIGERHRACPTCGAHVLARAVTCRHCGTALPPTGDV